MKLFILFADSDYADFQKLNDNLFYLISLTDRCYFIVNDNFTKIKSKLHPTIMNTTTILTNQYTTLNNCITVKLNISANENMQFESRNFYYSMEFNIDVDNIVRFVTYCTSIQKHLNSEAVKIIVFDLDDTIINVENKLLFPEICEYIEHIKMKFDLCILWSFGNRVHVNRIKKSIPKLKSIFDLTVDNEEFHHKLKAKYLSQLILVLHKKFKISNISYSCLIDNLPSNYTRDYNCFIRVPEKKNESFYRNFYGKVIEFIDSI